MRRDDQSDILFAVYDFAVSPKSFDVLSFLAEAERYRREKNLTAIHFVAPPPPERVARVHDFYDKSHEDWRINNIILPSCALLPSIRGITIGGSRAEIATEVFEGTSHVFPEGYSLDEPIQHHHTGFPILSAHSGHNLYCLQASAQARSYARQWIATHAMGRKVVTLTLREASFSPLGNSDIREWCRFARMLQDAGHFPVVVRDIETALEVPSAEFSGLTVFPEPVFNLDVRVGLYEESHVCAFVSNGPSTICFYNRDTRYLYFVSGAWFDSTPPEVSRLGIGFGTTPPFANQFQRWIWGPQEAGHFMTEFAALDRDIDRHRMAGAPADELDPLPSNREPLPRLAQRMIEWANHRGGGAEWGMAARCLELSDEYAAGDIEATILLGEAYWHLRRPADATRCFRAIAQSTRNADAFLFWGVVLESEGKLLDACDVYRGAIAEGVDAPMIRSRLANAEILAAKLALLRPNITSNEFNRLDTRS